MKVIVATIAILTSYGLMTSSPANQNNRWQNRLATCTITNINNAKSPQPCCDMQKNGELQVVKKIAQDDDIIFDVGAYHGEWTRHVLAAHKPKKVYALEPVPSSFEQLEKSLVNECIQPLNCALSDRIDSMRFYHYSAPGRATLSSLYRRSAEIEKKLGITPKIIDVPTTTLDHLCEQYSIATIDVLKIDTEGAELDVLRGAKKLLLKQQIGFIQFEYGGTYKDAGITLKEVCTLLTEHQYRIFKIIPGKLLHIAQWKPGIENYEYGNFLAVAAIAAPQWNTIQY